MLLVRIAWIVIILAVLWLFVLLWWMGRNPKYAEQIWNREVPYPWFFQVWRILGFGAVISVIGLIVYYIYFFASAIIN